jgi:circadian clock protein KaiB
MKSVLTAVMDGSQKVPTGISGLFRFRLYIAGDAQNSLQAVANLTELCRTHLPGSHEIEIVDVFQEPKRALAEGVFMTPTLINLTSEPIKRIVGPLSQTRIVLRTLGLGGR